jgi:ketosteroid isomerase-like protein
MGRVAEGLVGELDVAGPCGLLWHRTGTVPAATLEPISRQSAEAMSDADLATFRRFHEAWTAGDLETVLSLVEPEVVARPLHGLLFTQMEFVGRDGIREWHRQMTEPYDRFDALVEEVHEIPAGVAGLLTVVGYRGGEGLHARVGVVCEMRDGRIATLTARNAGDVEAEIRAHR